MIFDAALMRTELDSTRLDFTVLRNCEQYRLRNERSRSHDAVIRVYDAAGNVIQTHKHKDGFKDW